MTTLDRPPISRHLHCRRSVLACEPRFRRVRMILVVERLCGRHHAGLRALLSGHWHTVRTHSSWSRA